MNKANKPKELILQTAKMAGKGLTAVILGLFESFDEVYTYMVFDHYHRRYPRVDKKSYQQKVYSTIRRLENQGIINSHKTSKGSVYRINQSGRLKILAKKVFANKNKSTDGLSTVVIFDIPEEKKAARGYLRRLLLQNGFINLQRSVMISPNDLDRDFFELLEDLKIRPHVTVLKSKIIY